jgi:hypothetical protein
MAGTPLGGPVRTLPFMEATASGALLVAVFAAVAVAVAFLALRLLRATRGGADGSSDA